MQSSCTFSLGYLLNELLKHSIISTLIGVRVDWSDLMVHGNRVSCTYVLSICFSSKGGLNPRVVDLNLMGSPRLSCLRPE